MDSNRTKTDLATRVALMYYNDNMSQNEISSSLGISRSYVSQLLTFAKSSGIVKITINAGGSYLDEQSFAKQFALKQAFILSSDSQDYTDAEFGRFCAPYAMRLIRNYSHIGVNLGESVRKVISSIPKEDVGDTNAVLVTQIMGGCLTGEPGSKGSIPNELVFDLGRLLGCSCQYLNCPAFISNSAAREMMLREEGIRSVMNSWSAIDVVLMGMGQAGCGMIVNNIPDEFKREISTSGAVADINLNFFSADGGQVDILAGHSVMMPAEMIRRVSMKVVFAYGIKKAPAILAGLRAKMIDVLFTDSVTASAVVKLNENPHI